MYSRAINYEQVNILTPLSPKRMFQKCCVCKILWLSPYKLLFLVTADYEYKIINVLLPIHTLCASLNKRNNMSQKMSTFSA